MEMISIAAVSMRKMVRRGKLCSPTNTQTAISPHSQFSRLGMFEGRPTDKSSEIWQNP